LLKKAFKANTEAHNLSELSQERYSRGDYEWANDFSFDKSIKYREKSNLIAKAICLIKKNKLPIKWGVNNWIAYFSHNWEQISFHVFGNFFTSKCKKYNWSWCNIQHSDNFPKNFLNFDLI
jgi:hypothetical protein